MGDGAASESISIGAGGAGAGAAIISTSESPRRSTMSSALGSRLSGLQGSPSVRRDDQDGLGRVPGVEGGDGAPQHRSRQGRDGLAEAHLIRQNQVAVGRQRRLLDRVIGPVVHECPWPEVGEPGHAPRGLVLVVEQREAEPVRVQYLLHEGVRLAARQRVGVDAPEREEVVVLQNCPTLLDELPRRRLRHGHPCRPAAVLAVGVRITVVQYTPLLLLVLLAFRRRGQRRELLLGLLPTPRLVLEPLP